MLDLGNTVFYSVEGLFPDHWDSVFFTIVDNFGSSGQCPTDVYIYIFRFIYVSKHTINKSIDV